MSKERKTFRFPPPRFCTDNLQNLDSVCLRTDDDFYYKTFPGCEIYVEHYDYLALKEQYDEAQKRIADLENVLQAIKDVL